LRTRTSRGGTSRGTPRRCGAKSATSWTRSLRYRKDRVLTSQLTLNASLFAVRDELARKNRTFRLGTDPKEWGRQINDLRNVPPKHVPEERWPEFKHILALALQEVDRGVALYQQADTLGLGSLNTVITLERVMGHVAHAHERCCVFENDRPVAQPRTYDDVNASYKRVEAFVKNEFEPKVWFGGLQAFVQKARMKGHSAEVPGLKFLSFCMCARAMQTLTLPNESSITLITAEDEAESHMGTQGIDATEEDALLALRAATNAWTSGAIKLKDDGEVTVV
jgi:hypothetical protein